jgi:hypothetical protein
VETLKQSLSDQSSHHKQQVSDKSNAERNAQTQIDSLRRENSKLSDALEASREQTSSKEQELKLVKKEIEILHSDRQIEQMSALNESLAVQAREAEERAREALNAHAELESQLESLKAELETTRRSGTRSLDERNSLQQDLQASRDKLQKALGELETLRTEAAERAAQDGRRYTALEAAHRAEWDALSSRLTTLSSKFNNPASPKLAQFLVQPLQPGQQTKFVEELVRSLDEYISITNELLASTQDLGPTLRAELEQVRRSHEQEKMEWVGKVEKLEEEKQTLEKSIDSQRAGEREREELERVKLEVAGLKQQLVAAQQQGEEQTLNTSVEKALRELWKALPPNLEARAGASLESDLSSFKAVYEQPAPPPAPKNFGLVSAGVSGSLGGLFGLGKRNNTPTPSSTSSSADDHHHHHPSHLLHRSSLDFSVDLTLEKLKLLVENDTKLVDRLFKYEAEKDSHKNNSLRAQKLVSESQDALRIYQSQVRRSPFSCILFLHRHIHSSHFLVFCFRLKSWKKGWNMRMRNRQRC